MLGECKGILPLTIHGCGKNLACENQIKNEKVGKNKINLIAEGQHLALFNVIVPGQWQPKDKQIDKKLKNRQSICYT